VSTSKANAERLLHPPTSTASFSRSRLRVLAVVIIRRIRVITPVHRKQFDTTCAAADVDIKKELRIIAVFNLLSPHINPGVTHVSYLLVGFSTLTQL